MQTRALKKVTTVQIRAEKPLNRNRSARYHSPMPRALTSRFPRFAKNSSQSNAMVIFEKENEAVCFKFLPACWTDVSDIDFSKFISWS